MILIASARDDAHAKVVAGKLADRGAPCFWFDPSEFPAKVRITVSLEPDGRSAYMLEHEGGRVDLRGVRAIWHRRPGLPEPDNAVPDDGRREWVARESQEFLSGIWATTSCLQVPGLEHHRYAAENKLAQLLLAARVGFPIPRTVFGNRPESLLESYRRFAGGAITKVVSNPVVMRGDEEWSAFTLPLQRRQLGYYQGVRYAPIIIQEYVPKRIEIRATVVGSQVFAAAIHSQQSQRTRHDWRHYDFDKTPHEPHHLPDRVAELCVRLVRELHLNFGALDMVLSPAGEYVFLEINPNGQWAWIEDLTGLPISDAIADLLLSGGATEDRRIRGMPGLHHVR